MVNKEYVQVDIEHLAGGEGITHLDHWLSDDALPPNANMMATVTLEPGASVGLHRHDGEAEIYRILSGTGMYMDNGVETEVGPGFVTVCYADEKHALMNTGETALVFDAIIIGG